MFLETPRTGANNICIDTPLVDNSPIAPSLLTIEEETPADDRPIVV